MKRDELPSLLLLPFPPAVPSRLSVAYRPAITAALSTLQRRGAPAQLVIAVAVPILHGQFASSKTLAWSEAQALLAGIYSLVSVVCAELKIATELDGGQGSIDTTVLLVDHDRGRTYNPHRPSRPTIPTNNTVIVDLETFAATHYPWNCIFRVGTERGFELLDTFLKIAESKQTILHEQIIPVEGGLTFFDDPEIHSPAATQTPGHPVVCLGGTFDYLHPGHKLLLTAGALLLEVPPPDSSQTARFIIGITGDELLKNKKYAEYVQSWETRARNVIIFLSRLLRLSKDGWKNDFLPDINEKAGDFSSSFRDGRITIQCVEIQDPFGPTITIADMDALIVSGETRSGGQAVNDKRAELGWRALKVYEVDVLDAEEINDEIKKSENFSSKISSTAIRQSRAQATTPSKY
ncbi:hypothetical protein OQA88_1309 [Cercophora sp. LCS_1]